MKSWLVVFATVAIVAVMSVIGGSFQEQPAAGDRRGNRCFNGRYWKECGTPDAPVTPVGQAHSWRVVQCYTNDCIRDTLNGLPFERAAEAKLTTWKDSTYVWFRD